MTGPFNNVTGSVEKRDEISKMLSGPVLVLGVAHGQRDVVQHFGLGHQEDGLGAQVSAVAVDHVQQRLVVRQQVGRERFDRGHVTGPAQQPRDRRVRLQRPVVMADDRPVLQHPVRVVGDGAPQPSALVQHCRRIVPGGTGTGAGHVHVVPEQVYGGFRLVGIPVRHIYPSTQHRDSD